VQQGHGDLLTKQLIHTVLTQPAGPSMYFGLDGGVCFVVAALALVMA
jgi:hypothetical protein